MSFLPSSLSFSLSLSFLIFIEDGDGGKEGGDGGKEGENGGVGERSGDCGIGSLQFSPTYKEFVPEFIA